MMVVMLVSGLALTLGYQSLLQWQRAEQSLSAAGGSVRDASLMEGWWRDAVRGITSRYDRAVEGDSAGFSAVSSSAPFRQGGFDRPQRWSVEQRADQWALLISEGEQTGRFPLEGIGDASFSYLDDAGSWHERWPPALGVQQPRPAAIALLRTGIDGRTMSWIAAPQADEMPYFPTSEIEEF